jgi:trehalose/maltose hydrolase-like predicted phosphorylase
VLEQFDGYALLPDRVITARDANGRPVMEPDVRERADALACFDDRLIKEGDVVLIHDVLPDAYDRDQQRRDLAFYLPRTTMESSLSATPYAVVAARLGQAEEARALMMLSAGFNLDYWPRTNYRNGVHLAAFGGAWRVLCQGFLGQRYSDACLDLEPAPLPPTFGAIRMRLTWRGSPAELRYDGDRLVIAVAPDAAAPLRVRLRLASGVVVTPIAPGAATTVEVR